MNTQTQNQMTLSEAITFLGTNHVAHILASDDPMTEIKRRAHGAWQANDLQLARAYYALRKAVRHIDGLSVLEPGS